MILFAENKLKTIKYTVILLILAIAFSSCKKTSLTITGPGPELFLGKIQSGNWDGVTVTDNGNKITITGSASSDGSYTFENNILGVGGIYKNDKPTGDKDYIVTVPAGDNLYTIDMTEEGKKAINDILEIVGEDQALGVMVNIASNGGIDSDGNIDVDKLVGNSSITPEDVSKIESIVKNLPKGSFGDPDTIGTNKNPAP